jgi:hypothetical protein
MPNIPLHLHTPRIASFLAAFFARIRTFLPSHPGTILVSKKGFVSSYALSGTYIDKRDHERGHKVARLSCEENVNNSRSWLGLITFCITPALVVALCLAVLFAGVAVAFAVSDSGKPVTPATQTSPRTRVFAGLITDDHCGARHHMDSGMNPAECTKMCVRNGSKYVLVQGDKRYALAGNEGELDGFAGQRTNIAGTLEGNTIKVDSTSPGQ